MDSSNYLELSLGIILAVLATYMFIENLGQNQHVTLSLIPIYSQKGGIEIQNCRCIFLFSAAGQDSCLNPPMNTRARPWGANTVTNPILPPFYSHLFNRSSPHEVYCNFGKNHKFRSATIMSTMPICHSFDSCESSKYGFVKSWERKKWRRNKDRVEEGDDEH